ncbi:hypothetical protein [Nocardioides sp. GXZ039]
MIQQLLESGELEARLRAELAPFYASDEVIALLAPAAGAARLSD